MLYYQSNIYCKCKYEKTLKEVYEKHAEALKTLYAELEKSTSMMVAFTGPNYDEDIRAKLPDVEFIPIEGYEVRWFARLKSKHLPENSFRTYHPGYGNREYGWYQGVIDKIAELSK